ncbi:MAG TPA: hypothetical protein VGF24_12175 [Vicinamibacterales bacterium]|jgi:hypothetical protein
MALQLTARGQTLKFQPNGDLIVVEGEQDRQAGTWLAEIAAGGIRVNRFTYTIDGVDQPPCPAKYSFTGGNQLRVVLAGPDGDSEPADLVGFIEVDDQHDIVYHLTDDAGAVLGTDVVLYGDLEIERNTNALVIKLIEGGEAKIVGDRGIKSLEAAQNRIAELAADDLLRFKATTSNVLADGNLLDIPSKLEFAGSWDIQNGQLVFLSKIVGDLSRPDVSIGFGGKLGAVTAGFVYHADAEGNQEAAFTIRGQHVWRAGDRESAFNWDVSLGFSDKKFSADVDFDLNSVNRDGRRLSVAGNMTLKQADGNTLNLSLNLTAEYEWKDNSLVFKAVVSNEAGNFNYDLMLEGTIKPAGGGQLAFSIRYTNAEGSEGLTIGLDFVGDRDNAIQALSFHLQISPDRVELKIEAHISFRQRFVAGVGRVMEEGDEVAS